MNLRSASQSFFTLFLALAAGCGPQPVESLPAGKDGWLTGTVAEQLDTLAKHLRGNDLVMIEVDWRLGKLAQAGLAGNWEDAAYQLKKMRLSMELGKERRPKRGPSYDWFFKAGFPDMVAAVDKGDRRHFLEQFTPFVQHCNTCHDMEEVPHFLVELPPILRSSAD